MSEFDVKKAALNVAEDSVKSLLTNVVKPFAKQYIENSPNKVDDILLPFLDSLEAELLKFVDKIDGEVG
jgi:hypothetical protein